MFLNKTKFTAHKLASVDQAAVDQRLTNLDFRVLWLFASAADSRTGVTRCKQTDVAGNLGVTRRAVRRCLDRLVRFGYLEPIGARPGKYISAYNVRSPKRGPCGPVSAAPASGNEKEDPAVPKEDPAVQKEDPPFPHSPFKPSVYPSDQRDTEPREPRRAEGALGSHGEAADTAAFIGVVICPLAILDADVRQQLGDNATWLDAAKPVELANGVLTFAVLTVHQGDNIRKNCGPAILAAAGATELKFVVADPPKAWGRR